MSEWVDRGPTVPVGFYELPDGSLKAERRLKQVAILEERRAPEGGYENYEIDCDYSKE